ncbi:MAG: inner membrane protein YecN [Pseudomonadota bacterium]
MITGIYAGLCGLLLTVLYVRVSQRRRAVKIGVGTGGDAELEQRVRAHGNLIEAAPFVLILLYLVERTALDPIFIHAFGATFLLARLAHAQGISSTTGRSTGRFVGSLATVLILAALSVILVARSVSVLPVNS